MRGWYCEVARWRIGRMRAVASSANYVALWLHSRRLVRRPQAGPAHRLVFRGRFGQEETLLMRGGHPPAVLSVSSGPILRKDTIAVYGARA